ncbi:MAG: hypothetical protein M5U19_07895 [Microthrixaceae bacterium]|nr:hypothetical protein [Microthrixaceae bacterium]
MSSPGDVGDGSPQGDSDQLSVLHIDHVELQRMTDSIAEVEARASELAEAARGLAGHVESLAAGLEQSDDVATDGEPDGGGTGGPLSVGRREVVARRRRPVRLGRGLTVDSVEGLDALLCPSRDRGDAGRLQRVDEGLAEPGALATEGVSRRCCRGPGGSRWRHLAHRVRRRRRRSLAQRSAFRWP